MKRTFYFLQDSVTGQFYTGQNEWMSNFEGAAVYFQEKNAKSRIEGIISSWQHYIKYPVKEKYKQEFIDNNKPWPNDMANERKDLPNFGVVVVSGQCTVK